jgi:hypothetical protein
MNLIDESEGVTALVYDKLFALHEQNPTCSQLKLWQYAKKLTRADLLMDTLMLKNRYGIPVIKGEVK